MRTRLGLIAAAIAAVITRGAAAQEPLRLSEAIAEALGHSPELGPAADAVAAAGIQSRQASAQFGVRVLPSLAGGSDSGGLDTRFTAVTIAKKLTTGTDVRMSVSSLDSAGPGTAYHDRGYAFGVSQPLNGMLSRAAAAPLDAAARAARRADRHFAAARQQLILSVAEAYYGVLQAERLRAAAERARERARALMAASQARAEAGLDTQLDVMRTRLLVSRTESSLADREEAGIAARERLNVLLGRASDAPVALADEPPPPVPVTADADALVAAALARRAEAMDARARIDDARHAATVARWNLLPPLVLNVDYTRRGLGSAAPSLFRAYDGWHVSVTSSYALDRGTQAAAVASAELAIRAAEREAQAADARIAVDVRQAMRGIVKADQAAAMEQQARDIAERQLELARLRYERGLSDNLTVVDAENALAQADTAVAGAAIERGLARLRLQRACGTLDVEAWR